MGNGKAQGKRRSKLEFRVLFLKERRKPMNLEKKTSEIQINKEIEINTTAGLENEPRPHWRDPIVLIIVASY